MYLQILYAVIAEKRDNLRRCFPGAMPRFVGFYRLRAIN